MASNNAAWLAEQLGVSPSRVSQLVRERRIPRKKQYTQADVQRAKAAMLQARVENNATAGQVGEDAEDDDASLRAITRNPDKIATIKLKMARHAKIVLETQLLSGGYVKREDVERQNVAKVLAVRAKLEELPLRSALIANKTEVEAERILSEWVSEVCNFFASGAGVVGRSAVEAEDETDG